MVHGLLYERGTLAARRLAPSLIGSSFIVKREMSSQKKARVEGIGFAKRGRFTLGCSHVERPVLVSTKKK